jgi:hypothetical protein
VVDDETGDVDDATVFAARVLDLARRDAEHRVVRLRSHAQLLYEAADERARRRFMSRVLVILSLLLPRPAVAACLDSPSPSLPSTLAAALRTAALEPARVQSLLRRARVAGLLPQVTARVGKGAYMSVRDADTLDPSLFTSDTWTWEVMARWSLDRLVFDMHELRAAEAAGRLAEHRVLLLARIEEMWSERRALVAGTEPSADREARCAALTAILDALTGGLLLPATARSSDVKSLPRAPPRR